MAKCLEELLVYQRALEGAAAISAIVGRDSFKHDPRLRDQLASASASVAFLIAEGFEQSTDRYFAQYVYRARGSSREVRTPYRARTAAHQRRGMLAPFNNIRGGRENGHRTDSSPRSRKPQTSSLKVRCRARSTVGDRRTTED